MTSILVLDPAWTLTEPSGVALVTNDSSPSWRCVAVAPSYAHFIDLAEGTAVDWSVKPLGAVPSARDLISSSEILLGGTKVDLVTIDMPVSLEPITARRAADSAVSKTWGNKGAATHSPSSVRPGALSDQLREEFGELDFPLGTTEMVVGTTPALLEVYPHPALIVLMRENFRLEYKISRASKYWPKKALTPGERREKIVSIWWKILTALGDEITDINVPLRELVFTTNTAMKRYEDAIDALVCAWVGIKYLDRMCCSYGDASGAIWTPPFPSK